MNEHFKIPPGYRLAREEEAPKQGELNMWRGEMAESSRWGNYFRRTARYILNPKDSDYLTLVEKCRRDSGAFKKALKRAIERRGLSISLGKAKTKRKMSFFIRSPYFASEMTDEEKGEKVLQNNIHRDTFILHFDENHRLQWVRNWNFFGDDLEKFAKQFQVPLEHIVSINFLRAVLRIKLMEEADFLEGHYGDWEIMAEKIADIICEVIDLINERNSNLSQLTPLPQLWGRAELIPEYLDRESLNVDDLEDFSADARLIKF